MDQNWENKYGKVLCSVEDLETRLHQEQKAHAETKEYLASLQDKIRHMEVFNLDIMKGEHAHSNYFPSMIGQGP